MLVLAVLAPVPFTCPPTSTVEGVDVDKNQGPINWYMVAQSGRGFAIAAIGEGTSTDATFSTNWNEIRAAGMVRGGYFVFHPAIDASMQANVVIAAVGALGPGDLPVAADVSNSDNQSPSTIAANLTTFVNKVATGTGKTPIIYTSSQFWNGMVSSSAFASYPLWDASFGTTCPNQPTGWTDWKLWQYSNAGNVPGITGAADLDKFNGTSGDLTQFASGGAPGDDPGSKRDFTIASDSPHGGDAGQNGATGSHGGCCEVGASADGVSVAIAALGLLRRRRKLS